MTQKYETFADAGFVKILRMTPEVISVMGLSNLPEFSGLNSQLNDYSLSGMEARHQLLQAVYDEHLLYDYESLTDAEKLSHKVFEFFLEYMPFEPWGGLAGEAFALNAYPVCHHDGAPAETFNLLVNFHNVQTAKDAEDYLCRLALLPKMFSDLTESMRVRHVQQLSPPRSALKIIIDEMRQIIDAGVSENELLVSFVGKLNDAEDLSEVQVAEFKAKALACIEIFLEKDLPSFLVFLEEIHAEAPEKIGICRFENSDAYYQYCINRQTTTDLTAEEIYTIGEKHVAGLKEELVADTAALGCVNIELKQAIAEVLEVDSTGGKDTDATRASILEYYCQLVENTKQAIRPYFNLFPKAACVVQATPEHLETGRSTTYYPASATGEYPGIFELNLVREFATKPWARNALAYHEAYPGHHLQLTIAQELEHLPLFRRTFVNGGYLEGWAKYAESLPFEAGIDTDARYELKRKSTELLSASNLMLDVGIHIRGWSRDAAIHFSMENALVNRKMAEYLVDRISVTPAQTTAYVLGLLKVRELRTMVEERQGSTFRDATFHDVILGEGALPLDLLEQHVRASL